MLIDALEGAERLRRHTLHQLQRVADANWLISDLVRLLAFRRFFALRPLERGALEPVPTRSPMLEMVRLRPWWRATVARQAAQQFLLRVAQPGRNPRSGHLSTQGETGLAGYWLPRRSRAVARCGADRSEQRSYSHLLWPEPMPIVSWLKPSPMACPKGKDQHGESCACIARHQRPCSERVP